MRELPVGTAEAGQRLDKYLQKYMALAPKGFFYKMFRKKNITVNKKKCSGGERIKEGDTIQLFLSEETIEGFRRKAEASFKRPAAKLSVIYEDSQVILINKPAGMLSQKSGKEDVSLVEYLLSYLLEKGEVTEEALRSFRPSVCNRLDRNTSGLVTAGKTLKALQELSILFKERSIRKFYLCLVDGAAVKKRRLHGWLVKDEKSNQVKIYPEQREGSSEIHTAYEPVAAGRNQTLLKVELITGRSHQIRAHLAADGHPVIGDGKYGDSSVNRRFRSEYHLEHQLLHSWRMEFPELSGALKGLSGRSVQAPPPELFRKILTEEKVLPLPGITDTWSRLK
ncbi:RluA family pseudouridine synthase [Lacrimispora sp. NSJ-141]|uniref:RNA pseudouridylate synthase n=1 Tax=Lientehia hominis TaxID=2897778 RepID=A0AAP2RFN5_9FIRM|nr:RluA family pseudouridine synthase [Lientehia hominis]MCD2491101.1 RluA family pseudouridine synthase [Lientehia hominis]